MKKKSLTLLVALGLSFTACGENTEEVLRDLLAPVFTSDTNSSVYENQHSVITLGTTDASGVTFSISGGDSDLFEINPTTGVVRFINAQDYDSIVTGVYTYTFNVIATDAAGNATTQEFTVELLNEANVIVNGSTYETATSPHTKKVWLDRNLGADRACTALNDASCYGDYYQWGRKADGHEKSTSSASATQAPDLNTTGNTDFITSVATSASNGDWAHSIDTNGSLRATTWSSIDGTSICPVGFRVPTIAELKAETTDIVGVSRVRNNTDAFNSFLRLPSAGYRYESDNGKLEYRGVKGGLWSSSATTNSKSEYLDFYANYADEGEATRAHGYSVRCIKN